MSDENPHLRTVLRVAGTDQGQADDDCDLPSLKDGEYQAHARAANKPIYSIHFVNPKGEVRSFQYVHLDSGSRFEPHRITLTFLGMEAIRVVIEGRNLWRLYDYVHQFRMPWVMEAARDFAKDGQVIVTRVVFSLVKAENDEASL